MKKTESDFTEFVRCVRCRDRAELMLTINGTDRAHWLARKRDYSRSCKIWFSQLVEVQG